MKKIILILLLCILSTNKVLAKETIELSSCIDGDTIKAIINEETYTVRFLAINTPEYSPTKKEYYGKEASEYTCKMVKNAKKIELEYDKNSDKTDKYGRVLAWIFVDGKLLEEDLIEKGYAKVAYLYGDYKYANILKEKQELANAKNIGVWNRKEEEEYNKNGSFNEEKSSEEEKQEEKIIENIEVIIAGIIMLIITFVGKTAIDKNKSQKNVKKTKNIKKVD